MRSPIFREIGKRKTRTQEPIFMGFEMGSPQVAKVAAPGTQWTRKLDNLRDSPFLCKNRVFQGTVMVKKKSTKVKLGFTSFLFVFWDFRFSFYTK